MHPRFVFEQAVRRCPELEKKALVVAAVLSWELFEGDGVAKFAWDDFYARYRLSWPTFRPAIDLFVAAGLIEVEKGSGRRPSIYRVVAQLDPADGTTIVTATGRRLVASQIRDASGGAGAARSAVASRNQARFRDATSRSVAKSAQNDGSDQRKRSAPEGKKSRSSSSSRSEGVKALVLELVVAEQLRGYTKPVRDPGATKRTFLNNARNDYGPAIELVVADHPDWEPAHVFEAVYHRPTAAPSTPQRWRCRGEFNGRACTYDGKPPCPNHPELT